MTLSVIALINLTQAKAYLRIDTVASLHLDAEYVGMGDGATKEFTLDNIPVEGSLKLFVDNILQAETTHYTISDKTITFLTAPALNKPITASYDTVAADNTFEAYDDELLERLIDAATKKAEDWTGRAFIQRAVTETHFGDGLKILKLYRQPIVSITSVSWEKVDDFEGDGLTKIFTLGNTPMASSYSVYVDGVLKTETTDYSISDITLTFVVAPADGALIIVRYNVKLTLNTDYTEQLSIGRLRGSWLTGYEYQVVYNAGYGASRTATQALVPDAVTAVLEILSDIFENRSDRIDSLSISGLSSVSYKMPSRAMELLNPLRVNIL